MLTAGFGSVAPGTNFRRIINEIGVACKTLPNGQKLWLAYERETDKDTLEVTVIRRKETFNQQEADSLAKGWLNEYNQKKKAYFDSIAKSVAPLPPPRAAPLTKSDMEDLEKAKMTALQRQWRHCFELFEKQKTDPTDKIAAQQFDDAYLLDLIEQGGELWTCADGNVRADMQLIAALHKAAQRYASRGKSKIIDAALYLIAFNWELGWCYLSDASLAEKLSDILEVRFASEQVEKYRYRELGLVAKHLPGPSPNSP